jgi:hypothetical protein
VPEFDMEQDFSQEVS